MPAYKVGVVLLLAAMLHSTSSKDNFSRVYDFWMKDYRKECHAPSEKILNRKLVKYQSLNMIRHFDKYVPLVTFDELSLYRVSKNFGYVE